MHNTEELVGITLNDRYAILDKIGTGGMAIVYKAHDTVLDRDVAIKVLRENFDSESAIVSNFIKEARSSASLVHPNVVSVYDVCEYGSSNYMVMELVDGITLKEYIKRNPRLPWQEACDYAIQIGQGILAAHERGIIHRDIKPQNIIMDRSGLLKVTDFGIAKAMENDKSIVGGTAMGSVHYISPEQARGGFTDFRSDIYSLGVVLYEMLAGRVPFDGDTPVSVALMHIEEEAVNVKCVNMDVPADLAYVTMKAMNREQSKRYQSISEFIEDLRAVLADENLPSKERELEEAEAKLLNIQNENKETHSDEKQLSDKEKEKRVRSKSKEKVVKRKSERNAVVLALVTVAAIVMIILGIIFLFANPFSRTVPDLRNISLEEATTLAQRNGYTVSDEVEYSFSDSVPENAVISQFPEAGKEAPKHEKIKLVISLGATGGAIEVPNFVGARVDDVLPQIQSLLLVYNIVYEANDEIEIGTVIRQTPLQGTHINEGDVVTIHISSGQSIGETETTQVKTPALQLQTVDAAKAMITANSLTVGSVSYIESDAVDAGKVIKQKPDAGTIVKSGTMVSLVVSSGPQSIQGGIETLNPDGEASSSSDNGQGSISGNIKRYSVKIPDNAKETVHIKIVANGNVMHDSTHSKSEGVIVQEITGSGNVRVQTYIDAVLTNDEVLTF